MLTSFRDIPIKRKVTLVILVSSLATLLLASTGLFLLQWHRSRETIVADLRTQAEIVAANSTAAMAFGDATAAQEILSSLAGRRHLACAGLVQADGKRIAHVGEEDGGDMRDSTVRDFSVRFDGPRLRLTQPMYLDRKFLGTLTLAVDFRAMQRDVIAPFASILAGTLAASALLAILLSAVMQRVISQPILDLAAVVRKIAERRDYALRARAPGRDELGRLTQDFNQMLGQIQAKDSALQQSEERLRNLCDNAHVGMYQVTPEGQVQLANPALLNMLGYDSFQELAAMNVETEGYAPGRSRRDFVERVERDGEVKAYESAWRRKDGTTILVIEYARAVRGPDGKTLFYEGTVEDITERRQSETRKNAFATLGQRLSAATDSVAASRLILEVADALLGWDACSLQLYSADDDVVWDLLSMDLIGGKRTDVVVPGEFRHPSAMARRVLTAGAELILRDSPCESNRDGLPFGDVARPSASLMNVPVRDAGRLVGILSIQSYRPKAYGPADLETLQALGDLCGGALERLRMEEKLRQSQQKLEALINSIEGIVWECTPDTCEFTYVSRQGERLLGYAPEQWTANPHFRREKLHPDDAAQAMQMYRQAVAGRRAYHMDYRMIAADGRTVWIRETGMVMVQDDRPAAVRGIFQDITEQKRAAEELAQLNRRLIDASRMAGMAEIATGVLHNVGNVLNSVNVSATLLADRVQKSRADHLVAALELLPLQSADLATFLTAHPKGKQLPNYFRMLAQHFREEKNLLQQELESLRRNVEHLKEIVAMQQSYAKVGGVIEPLALASLAEDAIQTVQFNLDHHHIRLERDFADLPPVASDRYKVMQILLNLLRNAIEAVRESARSRKTIQVSVRPDPDGRVRLQVRDDGVGIAPENLTRIFSHGFTTKRDGHGFGLHLSALSARQLGGALTVESAGPGLGATFSLELPPAPPSNSGAQPVARSLSS